MKKILSLVLALTMVIGVFVPGVSAVEVNPREQLFNSLRTKFSTVRNEENMTDAKAVLSIIFLEKGNIYDSITADASYKDYLGSKGITKEAFNNVIGVLESNKAVIRDIIVNTELNYGDVSTQLDTLFNELYAVLPAETKTSIETYAAGKEEQIDVLVDIASALISETIGSGNYSVSTGKWTSLNLAITDVQIATANSKIPGGNPLGTMHKNIVNSLLSAAVNELTSTLKDTAGKLLFASKLITKTEVDVPTGGGVIIPPTTPEVEVPSTDAPATVTIGKEAVNTTTDAEGRINVEVKETEAVKAVEALKKAAGEGKEANLVLNLDTVEGLNFLINLSEKLIETLVKNNVGLEVKTADAELLIPAETLAGIKVEAGAKLQLKVDEVDTKAAQNAASDNAKVKRVVDLSLLVVKGSEETYVSGFKAPVTVKVDVKGLGNKDLIAVYYLNEKTNKLEFVTGKVVGNKAVLKLKHFSKYAVVESSKTFGDTAKHWSKLYVESMAAKNVIGGYGDNTFRPQGNVTRAEFAKMVVNALELDLVKYDGQFADVKADAWYADYVATMVENGIAGGYNDNTFRPNQKITRAEMAVMIGNVLDVDVTQAEIKGLKDSYRDANKIAAWAAEAVVKVSKTEIMNGNEASFNPNGTATRAEATTSIYRLYNK